MNWRWIYLAPTWLGVFVVGTLIYLVAKHPGHGKGCAR